MLNGPAEAFHFSRRSRSTWCPFRTSTPAAVQKALPRGKKGLIGEKPDEYDHQHDRDDLVHGVQLTPVMQKMAQAETGENGDVDLGSHQRAPSERPALFHAADQKRQ